MALLKGKLFAGALFAGLLLGYPEQAPVEPPVEVAQAARPNSSAGAYYDTGRGYVKKDHGWVRATKFSIADGKAFNIAATQTSGVLLGVALSAGVANPCSVSSISAADVGQAETSAIPYTQFLMARSDACVSVVEIDAKAHPVQVDWLSADELVVILETMT